MVYIRIRKGHYRQYNGDYWSEAWQFVYAMLHG